MGWTRVGQVRSGQVRSGQAHLRMRDGGTNIHALGLEGRKCVQDGSILQHAARRRGRVNLVECELRKERSALTQLA